MRRLLIAALLLAFALVRAEIAIQHPTARLESPFKDKQQRYIVTAQMMQALQQLQQLKELQQQQRKENVRNDESRSTRKDNGEHGDRQPLRFGKRQVGHLQMNQDYTRK